MLKWQDLLVNIAGYWCDSCKPSGIKQEYRCARRCTWHYPQQCNGSSKTEVAMMDMNGDGFPDIIAGGTIQYTNSQGGLSGEIYKGIGANNSDNASEHGDMAAIQ